jgi:rfaE bifunctional protein kinase chain/domain
MLPADRHQVTPAVDRLTAGKLLDRMSGLAVLVVGDVALDEYLVGRAERLSREGPVPVLAFDRRFIHPGGAANVARNIASLGARATQIAVVGADGAADELRAALRGAGVDDDGLVVDASRPTTVKTRIAAEGPAGAQQVARIDRQVRRPVGGSVEQEVVASIEHRAGDCDALLVSDYKSGMVTSTVRDAARAAAVAHGQWLTVDSQGDLDHFAGFDLVRAARRDAEASLGRALADEADFEQAATELRNALGARLVVLSRGAEGMSVADAAGYAVVRPDNVREVADVTGAGDTVIAVLTLALAAGATTLEAVALANRAAGLVVRRLGVAAPSSAEILATYER